MTTTEKRAPFVQRIDDELIFSNRQALKQRVLDLLDQGERKFVLDFSGCGYIDSSGCGVLVSISKEVRKRGGELVIAGLNDDLRILFELTKMDAMFSLADSVLVALRHLEKSA